MMLKNARQWLAVVAILTIAATLLGCAAPAAPSPTAAPAKAAAPTAAPAAAAAPTSAPAKAAPAKPSVYRIGHVTPLTGSAADFGVVFNQSAQLAVDEVNAKGGVDGTKLELVAEDSMADPKQGVTAFNKLAQVDKLPVVLVVYSSVIAAIAPIADETKVLALNYAANATNLRGAAKFLFSSFPLADADITVLAQYAHDQLKANKAAVMYINADLGLSASAAFKSAFESKGGKMVDMESFVPDAMDYRAQLAKIKAAEPDVIFVSGNSPEPPRILMQAREMGIKAQFVGASAFETDVMLQQAGEAAEGAIYSVPVPPDTDPPVKEFLDKYKAKYGKAPIGSGFNMSMWDTVVTIIPDAIKYAQQKGYGYTGDGLRQAITELKSFDTKVTGKTTFQFPGQDVKKPVTLKRVNFKNKSFDTVTVVQAQ